MTRQRITIIDLISNKPSRRLYSRLMKPNFASIMPQAAAVWCEELGHEVRFVTYTGGDEIGEELLGGTDVAFITAFTLSAQLAYALSNLFRRRGAVTVLGGPHARCYPEDSRFYFDYVLGLTDKTVIAEVLADGARHRPLGREIGAAKQPAHLPGVKERWKFIKPTIDKAPWLKIVPMIGSTGCPYTCSFCIDSVVPYQTLGFDQIREDLQFLQTRMRRPRVAWHDPNFGVRFDEYLGAIEDAVPPGRINFIAESSLSLLTEERLARLERNGFLAMLPGVESWFSHGNKSKASKTFGLQKVRQVADHVDMILRHIPFVQTNFVMGLDCDEGPEPFELTKKFMELAPGAYPAFSLFTAYGRAAPLNLDLQRAGRVLPLPFHFLNSTRGINVRPKNYAWPDFFAKVADLNAFAHAGSQTFRRFRAADGLLAKTFGALRGGGAKKVAYYNEIGRNLVEDPGFRSYFEGDSTVLPEFFRSRIKSDLGPFWDALPAGALEHDPYAYSSASLDQPVAGHASAPQAIARL